MPLPLLYLCRYEPTSFFEPEVRFFAHNPAGIAVTDTADTLAGSPAYIENAVDGKGLPFLEFDLDRTHLTLCVEAHEHRHISLFSVHRYPPKKPTGWTV